MKFKSDEQRKAVFANIGSSSVRKSKVNSSSIKNFEISISKIKPSQKHITSRSLQRSKNPSLNDNIKTTSLSYSTHLEDIKTKGSREFCDMCRRKGLSLTKGRCKVCEKETSTYVRPHHKKIDKELVELLENMARRIEIMINDHVRRNNDGLDGHTITGDREYLFIITEPSGFKRDIDNMKEIYFELDRMYHEYGGQPQIHLYKNAQEKKLLEKYGFLGDN